MLKDGQNVRLMYFDNLTEEIYSRSLPFNFFFQKSMQYNSRNFERHQNRLSTITQKHLHHVETVRQAIKERLAKAATMVAKKGSQK